MSNDKKKPSLTVDGVLHDGGKVLMIKRQIQPFLGHWVLPGGHVEYGEKVKEALRREIFEETNIEIDFAKLVGVYSDPDRDPRGHVVSCAYMAETGKPQEVALNKEASEYKFFEFGSLPEKIGYDHRKIILDAKDKI
ncbi:MAG: NUDIX domain-containing protein [Candidatus Magasanikbacteria bacterium]